MKLAEFLAKHESARAEWEAVLAAIPQDQYGLPVSGGEWTVKDHIAHVTWYEHEMMIVLSQRSIAGGSPLWETPTDGRNALIFKEIQEKPLLEVLAEARSAWAELWPLLRALSEEELNDPALFTDMPAEWKPWEMIASNTYEHYQEHTAILRSK
jgi:hypothetical protein